ncbi:MAG: hypothetical protein HY735_11595 [Verrucomicrobia bacterium]|nr:hypothetical protein [Verrucomicrobiota bacterium]
MLKVGCVLLTVWGAFNFLLAGLILMLLTLFQKHAPMLFIVFEESEIARLDSKVLAATKSLAILFNGCAAGLAALSLFVTWGALIHGHRWALWALLLSAGLAQAMGFVADAVIGWKTLIPNSVLTLLFLVGIVLAGWSFLKSPA